MGPCSVTWRLFKMDVLVGCSDWTFFVCCFLVPRIGGSNKEYWMCWCHVCSNIGSGFWSFIYWLLNISCWLHLFTAFKSNFTVLFSSRNRLLVLSYAAVILVGRCYAGHTNKKRVSPGYWHTGHSLSDQIQKADETARPMTFTDLVCNENISAGPWDPHSLHGKT